MERLRGGVIPRCSRLPCNASEVAQCTYPLLISADMAASCTIIIRHLISLEPAFWATLPLYSTLDSTVATSFHSQNSGGWCLVLFSVQCRISRLELVHGVICSHHLCSDFPVLPLLLTVCTGLPPWVTALVSPNKLALTVIVTSVALNLAALITLLIPLWASAS